MPNTIDLKRLPHRLEPVLSDVQTNGWANIPLATGSGWLNVWAQRLDGPTWWALEVLDSDNEAIWEDSNLGIIPGPVRAISIAAEDGYVCENESAWRAARDLEQWAWDSIPAHSQDPDLAAPTDIRACALSHNDDRGIAPYWIVQFGNQFRVGQWDAAMESLTVDVTPIHSLSKTLASVAFEEYELLNAIASDPSPSDHDLHRASEFSPAAAMVSMLHAQGSTALFYRLRDESLGTPTEKFTTLVFSERFLKN